MELCDFFIEVAQIEKSIEMSREYLSQLNTYHPYTAFKTIDQTEKGIITAQSVQRYLHEHGFLRTQRECSIIFYKSVLKYADFLRFILPSDETLSDATCAREQTSKLSNEAAFQLAKHLDKEIALMNSLHAPNISELKCGTAQSIREYFHNNKAFIYQTELDGVMRRLDFYGDGSIDLELLKLWSLNLVEQQQTLPNKSPIRIPPQTQSTYNTPKKNNSLANSGIRSSSQQRQSAKSTTQTNIISDRKTNKYSTEKKYLQTKQHIRGQMAAKKQIAPTVKKQLAIVRKVKLPKHVEILEYMLDQEIRMEKLKIQLAEQRDFNAFDAFKGLDRHLRGFITYHDYDYFMSQKQGTSIMLFDEYPNNQMMFSNFIHLIQPQTQYYADIMHNRLPRSEQVTLPLVDIFTQHTIRLLFDVLKLVQQPPIKLKPTNELFTEIDSLTKDNYIGVSDLQQYLYENNLRYTHQEVLLLLIKYDVDKDGRLSIEEFMRM